MKINNANNEIESLVNILNISFSTIAKEFNLTKENALTNSAFITMNQLKYEINNGLNMYIATEVLDSMGCIGIRCSKNPEIWYIEKLAVIPYKRHLGIGSELLQFAINEIAVKKAQKVSIGIINENKKLKTWYEKHGFYDYEVKKLNNLPFTVCLMYKDL